MEKFIHRNALPFFWEGHKDIVCLLIHGFTGSPADMRVLGDYLQNEGYGVAGLLLPGHGTTPQDLATTRWPEWFNAVENEYLRLRDRYKIVIPMGLSMGGILALHLAAKYDVKGLVSFSAPVFFVDERAYHVAEMDIEFFGKERTAEEKARNLAKGRFSYDITPTKAMASLLELIDLVKTELSGINVPSLLIQSQDDPTVSPQSAQYLYDQLGSTAKELVWLEKSGHVITLGTEQEQVFQVTELFLQKNF